MLNIVKRNDKSKQFHRIHQDEVDYDNNNTDVNSLHSDLQSEGDDNDTTHNSSAIAKFLCCLRPVFNIWSILTFQWMQDLLILGNQRALEASDLYPLLEKDKASYIYKQFKTQWNIQLNKAKSSTNKTPSLTFALMNAYGYPFLCAGILKLINDSCQFVGPYLLNKLIKLLSDPTQPSTMGYYYVLGLFLSNVTMSLCLRQYFWWCYRVGLRLRSAVITSVYQKSLVISTSSLQHRTTGEISNLMAVDSSRLQVYLVHALILYIYICVYAINTYMRYLYCDCKDLSAPTLWSYV